MKYNLTILERMVLECLQKSEKSIGDIQNKTSIEINILSEVIKSLLSKNLINFKDAFYSLNRSLNQAILAELNDSTALLCEVNEIINSCVRSKLDGQSKESFKLRKVNMSEREEKIYTGLLYNLEAFLNSLTKSDEIKDQKVIFWGEGNYEDIKNNILSY